MTVLKGQRTDEEPMNYGRRLEELALDTLNDDLIRGMLPRRNNPLKGDPVSRKLTTQCLSCVDSSSPQGDLSR